MADIINAYVRLSETENVVLLVAHYLGTQGFDAPLGVYRAGGVGNDTYWSFEITEELALDALRIRFDAMSENQFLKLRERQHREYEAARAEFLAEAEKGRAEFLARCLATPSLPQQTFTGCGDPNYRAGGSV